MREQQQEDIGIDETQVEQNKKQNAQQDKVRGSLWKDIHSGDDTLKHNAKQNTHNKLYSEGNPQSWQKKRKSTFKT